MSKTLPIVVFYYVEVTYLGRVSYFRGMEEMLFKTHWGNYEKVIMNRYNAEFEMAEKHSLVIREFLHTALRAEEEVVKSVLAQLLEREITLEDYKKVTRVFREGITEKYNLTYDGINLGIVEKNFSPNLVNRYCICFTPKNN